MGDRSNPIKFGPEWLRNQICEPSGPGGSVPGRDGSGGQQTVNSSGNGATQSNRPAVNINTNTQSKVLLAKLRYGREEMLALYDKTAEAPAQLKAIDLLYQPKGKLPYALSTFEGETQRDMRGQAQGGGIPPGESRYGLGRGRTMTMESRARVLITTDSRGRSRGFNRPTSLGRGLGWHGNPRNAYSGMPDDYPVAATLGLRPSLDQTYRPKRQTNTNWRQQQNREEGVEWRSSDGTRRPDKWDRDWPERNNQDKAWSTANRRTWVGGDTAEDALPEWAVENSEACGGTFDSSGAFHGYSNDDSNLPRNTESHALTRSQTHGNFVRSKTAEDGSEEWWASEKAKKLSPKRLDSREIKFKNHQHGVDGSNNSSGANTNNATSCGPSTGAIPKNTSRAGADRATFKDNNGKKPPNKDDKGVDRQNRPDTEESEKLLERPSSETEKQFNAMNEHSNDKHSIKSVMLTANNNILRQKHQNIQSSTSVDSANRQTAKTVHYAEDNNNQPRQMENNEQLHNVTDKIVQDILEMKLDDNLHQRAMKDLLGNGSNITPGLNSVNSIGQIPGQNMPMRMTSPLMGMSSQNNPIMPNSSGLQGSGVQSSMMQPLGITNSMLNASLGLPMPNSNSGIPLQRISPPSLSNPGMLPTALQGRSSGNVPSNLQSPGLQSSQPGFPMSSLQTALQSGNGLESNIQGVGMSSNSGMPSIQGMQGSNMLPNMGNNSLFLGQGSSNNTITNSNDIGNPEGHQNMFQHNSSIYSNMMQQSQSVRMQNMPNLYDQWYYEDPNKTIQGPFSTKEMLNWLRAGFFCPSLMVRRACETVMRPLGSYGLMPFGRMDVMGPYPMGAGYDLRPQQSHDNMINQQPGLGPDVPKSMGMPSLSYIRRSQLTFNPEKPSHVNIQVAVASMGSSFRPGMLPVNPIGAQRPLPPPIPMPIPRPLPDPIPMPEQNKTVESLWGQPSNNAQDMMWMQGMNNAPRNDNQINRLPMFFWDMQIPAALPPNALLPDDIAKEMKTEDEILAQIRGGPLPQPPPPPAALSFLDDQPLPSVPADFTASADLNMQELQKLIQSDAPPRPDSISQEQQQKSEQQTKPECNDEPPKSQPTKPAEAKPAKTPKVEEKAKSKDNGVKPKTKKTKEDKKEEPVDTKVKEDETKTETRSAEPSPSPKNKKEDKSKKELEKEKKEWIKEGFTIVKGAEKNKDNKKKAEETKAAEEAERKRKEEEKIAEEEVRKRQMEILRKQQEIQSQQQQQQARQAELINRRAPWSASNQTQASPFPGPTLAEIQRLEREKKLEQMKEQQQMMQIIAQQQQAAMAREQELQSGLGWAKKRNNNSSSQTLAEIQAETRKQAAAAAAVSEEKQPTPPPPANAVPWGNVAQNGSGAAVSSTGFWDMLMDTPKPPKPAEPPKQPELKPKKKVTVVIPPKKETSPSTEFDNWCTAALTSWRDCNIDVPTFVTFLKDIESPYEVKDYVKCYLGDTKEANDFARQFLERRSRLLRVGMVTPSDDLCSPAIAVNPRTNSGSDYTDVKGKGKKAKKNKMLKVDARNILGFSVTAAEDRINVGDIDTV